MKRHEAIREIIGCLNNEYLIASNGMISREVHATKDRARNFYMLGSMGLAPAIGLGISVAKPKEKVVVILGDGNMLMSLGTLSTIGMVNPKNLVLIVLDNECHESTGEQMTASSTTSFDKVAILCGIKSAKYPNSLGELKNAFNAAIQTNEASLIHIKVEKGRIDAPRIKIEPSNINSRIRKELAD